MLSRSISRSASTTSAAVVAAARCSCAPTAAAAPSTSAASCSRYSSTYTSSSFGGQETLRRSRPSPSLASRKSSRNTFATTSQPPSSAEASSPPSELQDFTPAAARSPESLQQWLRQSFPAFRIPADVAAQMVTHESWGGGKHIDGHNRRLSFLGRRALKLYMALFLHSCAAATPEAAQAANHLLGDQQRLDDLLQTSRLGDKVGRELRLEQVMRWVPAVSSGQQVSPREMGLFKIRGICVEALVGAIYHQHGAASARSFFQARVLPVLLRDTFPAVAQQSMLAMTDAAQDEGEKALLAMQTEVAGRQSTKSVLAPSSASAVSAGGSSHSSGSIPNAAIANARPSVPTTPPSPAPSSAPFSAARTSSHRPRHPHELRDAARADIALAAAEGRPVSNEQRAVASG